MESLHSRDFSTVPSAALIDSALELAVGFDRAVYDCLYIAWPSNSEPSSSRPMSGWPMPSPRDCL